MTDVVEETNDIGGDEIPDDFFDEFEDTKFLDENVETIIAEQSRLIRSEDSAETTKSNEEDPAKENKPAVQDEEPIVRRCLDEIDKLTKSIRRRKRKLREEITANDRVKRSKERRSRSHSRDRGRSNTPRNGRNRRSSPRRSPMSRRRSRGRSRGYSRERSRERSNWSRDRRSSRNRRDMRSRSTSPDTQPRSMSFLEELAQKFAAKGQEFPEKNLLMQLRARQHANDPTVLNTYPVNVGYPPCEVPQPYMQMPMQMYSQPYQPQWNGNYMMDPMSTMQHAIPQTPLPMIMNVVQTNVEANSSKAVGGLSWNPPINKAEAVAKCRDASKILRSEENKVPKLRFLFTRTSMPIAIEDENIPPLQSRKNVEFDLTAEKQQPLAPLKFLPPRTRELVKILGYNCSHIISRLRLKEFGDKMIHEIENMDAEKKKTKERSVTECGMQTEAYKCPSCLNHDSKTFSNKSVQVDAPKKVSIRTQTNEKDYREPLIRSLSRMTPGQLVAVSDFANLIFEPRPSTSVELFKVREQLMDIYNLSERGTEAIEAEREREQDMRRRAMNNCSMVGPMDDLRATIRGTSDNNMGMGRIPPPPPIMLNYHANDDIELRLAAEEEEREQRLQQICFEEQRLRELEWDHQQQVLQQQQQQQQQFQREQEEEIARLEMFNERKRNAHGRGQPWGGGRGRGRY